MTEIRYYNGDNLSSIIHADEQTKTVSVENFTDHPVFRAFGINEHPSWEDYEEFLESRCFPRTRQNVKFYLKQLGLDWYDPLAICKKTNGKFACDTRWMEIIETPVLEVIKTTDAEEEERE